MNDVQAQKYIVEHMSITHQMIIIAKGYIVNHFDESTESMIKEFIIHNDSSCPTTLAPDSSDDALKQVSEYLSWNQAVREAIWGLIHSNLLIPIETNLSHPQGMTIMLTDGRNSSWINFRDELISVPINVCLAPSYKSRTDQPLSDPDLYLHELSIPNLDVPIEEALREAVECFRHELYTACLAMLGKASEGTWIELGLALWKLTPTTGKADPFQDPFTSVKKKIQEVLKLYNRQDVFKSIADASGIKPHDLEGVSIWADAVRDARNSIHYGVEPAMSNSYEKVAALLIGAKPHFNILYKLKKAADEAVT